MKFMYQHSWLLAKYLSVSTHSCCLHPSKPMNSYKKKNANQGHFASTNSNDLKFYSLMSFVCNCMWFMISLFNAVVYWHIYINLRQHYFSSNGCSRCECNITLPIHWQPTQPTQISQRKLIHRQLDGKTTWCLLDRNVILNWRNLHYSVYCYEYWTDRQEFKANK